MEFKLFLLIIFLMGIQLSNCANNKLKACQEKLQKLQNDYNLLKLAGQCTCNCEGIQGEPGPTGPQGPPGPPGPTGSQLPTTCPNDFIEKSEFKSCYKLFTVEPLSWIDALSHCQSMGANLVRIESDDEQQFLKKQIMLNNNPKVFWIGLNEFYGFWSWSSQPGLEYQPIGGNSYTNWNVDESQPENNDQNCAATVGDPPKRDYKWHNDLCISKKSYICEIKLA